MNKNSLKLKYDWSAFDKGSEIDVKLLAPSLISFAEIIEESNRIINGENTTVKVTVKAHEEWSFIVDLWFDMSIVESIKDAVNFMWWDSWNWITNIVEILWFLWFWWGLLYKWKDVLSFMKEYWNKKTTNLKYQESKRTFEIWNIKVSI